MKEKTANPFVTDKETCKGSSYSNKQYSFLKLNFILFFSMESKKIN